MDDGVTIFCLRDDPALVVDSLSHCGGRVGSVGSSNDWELLEIEFGSSRLEMSRKMFQPGSEFSKLILGALNYFRNANSDRFPEKARVFSVLEQCDMILGITAHPNLSPTDERWACVLGLAKALDGLIFDGYAMRDDTRAVILDPDNDA